ncbi:MAG: hypothetical protein D4R84_02620 [Rhodocyclaceae bacterium]|nr:MAG: hypothetical protein D4R84_02620 [Rhodocyclaceae bacterium]
MTRFKGVVHVSGRNLQANWGIKALKVLAAVKADAKVVHVKEPEEAITITVDGHTVHLGIVGGTVFGNVPESPAAGALTVCLVGLQCKLGGIALVGDDQGFFSSMVRFSNKLYQPDWDRVERMATNLGLMGSPLNAAAAAQLIPMF